MKRKVFGKLLNPGLVVKSGWVAQVDATEHIRSWRLGWTNATCVSLLVGDGQQPKTEAVSETHAFA